MPDEKRNQKKGKSESKEQRKPRQGRQQAAESKHEKKAIPEKGPNENPVSNTQEPGPEFYNNLKRETEDILKITEEENAKYKKKEILSNWSKYELPIESYDDIEEHNHLGADYEKLIQAPVTVGGHFQFKHEKSWDNNTGPSLYDKYFDINMDNFAMAISTIPFYERHNLPPSMFTEADLLTMNNRSMNYKQKYYKDKAFSTPELQLQDKLLQKLKDDTDDPNVDESKNIVLELPPLVADEKRESKDYTIVDATKSPSISSDLQGHGDIEKCIPVELSQDIKSSVTISQEKPVDPQAAESPEDLEKWLDDFLEG